jgi:uncharacterized protein (DUF1501 family)
VDVGWAGGLAATLRQHQQALSSARSQLSEVLGSAVVDQKALQKVLQSSMAADVAASADVARAEGLLRPKATGKPKAKAAKAPGKPKAKAKGQQGLPAPGGDALE